MLLAYTKSMNKFLIFLTLDFASKYLAAVIAPDNNFFKLHYNTNLAFNYDAGHFLTYVLPCFMVPVAYFYWKKLSPRTLPLVMAGIIGNLVCRFLPGGVVDFLNFQLFINNFADIYLWVAGGIMSFDHFKAKENQTKEISESLQKEMLCIKK